MAPAQVVQPLVMVGLVGSLLLGGCSRATRQHTYHVTESQLDKMRDIANIKPCPHGPTVFAGISRAEGGGVVHIECPVPTRKREKE